MARCPYCQSTLLQREYDRDITCLLCSRTVSLVPVGLPHVSAKHLEGRKTPGPNLERRVAAEARRAG